MKKKTAISTKRTKSNYKVYRDSNGTEIKLSDECHRAIDFMFRMKSANAVLDSDELGAPERIRIAMEIMGVKK